MLELGNLLADDLSSLALGDTVAEDYNVGGVAVFVSLCKCVKTLLEALLKLSIDNLLALLLHNEVRVVLGHGSISRGGEADDRVAARMAHVNTNKHCLLVAHLVGELEVEEVAAHLAVDLLEDIGGL